MGLQGATRIALILVSLSLLASIFDCIRCINVALEAMSVGFSFWSRMYSPVASLLGTGGVLLFLYALHVSQKAPPE